MMQDMFGDTVTLYKRKSENGAEKWIRTVINGVYWDEIQGATAKKTGLSGTDSVLLIVPFSNAENITFCAGDHLIHGCCDYEVISSAKELKPLGSVIVTSVDNKSFGGRMAHFEVSAK